MLLKASPSKISKIAVRNPRRHSCLLSNGGQKYSENNDIYFKFLRVLSTYLRFLNSMQFSQFLCLRYIGHLDTFHKLSNENSKKVKKYKAVKKYNLYASSGQSSKSFLVGDGHGQNKWQQNVQSNDM